MDLLLCYHVLLLVVSSVSLMLLWVGFLTPGWLAVTFQEQEAREEFTVSSLNRSMWYDIHCPQELETCKACKIGEGSLACVNEEDYDSTKYTDHYIWLEGLMAEKEEWVAWRVIMTVVVVIASIGYALVIMLVLCMFRTFTYRAVATGGFFAWLLPGLLVWVPVGMVADLHVSIEDEVNDDVAHDATLHIPYSVVIAAMGGFVALITAIMLLWLTGVCRKKEESSDSGSSQTDIISEESYKSGTIIQDHRYYGPYPYYPPEMPEYYREQHVERYIPSSERTPNSDQFIQYPGYPGYGGYAGNWEAPSWGPSSWYDNNKSEFRIPRPSQD